MIPKMRAVAIDDQQAHLDAIQKAATSAGFGCVPLLYPTHTDGENLEKLGLDRSHVRIIITDLHLDTTSETRDPKAIYGLIGGLIANMKLPPWTPYVLVLWTQHTDELDGLKEYLEERLGLEKLPGLLVALAKVDYGIPGEVNHEKLWNDLREKIAGSRGLNVLLQWEAEIIQSADKVVRKLLQVARIKRKKSIEVDSEIDQVLSLIAQTATSDKFASNEPRTAANEGLLPLLTDEMEHLNPAAEQLKYWSSALSRAVAEEKIVASKEEVALLNDALHISRDGVANGSDRGAVVKDWHTEATFKASFGIDLTERANVFGLASAWPNDASIKYVQIEGLCDSTQKKKGVVPFLLACEVSADTKLKLKGKGLPAFVEESPTYIGDDDKQLKLIVNLRFFFTLDRDNAKTLKADFRLRESLINKWAYAWANHATRPGIVEFHT